MLKTNRCQFLYMADNFLILEAYSTAICFDLNH